MQYLFSFIALDMAKQPVHDVFSIEYANPSDAREARHAAELAAAGQERPSFARRALAHGLAAVSRGSATAVRHLDDVVAEDLGRSLSAAK
jgi:hypothetical protein